MQNVCKSREGLQKAPFYKRFQRRNPFESGCRLFQKVLQILILQGFEALFVFGQSRMS